MKTIVICNHCHNEIKIGKKLIPILSVKVEYGIIVKRVICSNCEERMKKNNIKVYGRLKELNAVK